MLKKLNDILAGWRATMVGGAFLLMSFILPRAGFERMQMLAWVTIIICGIPLLYLALWRVVHNKGISKISSALLISIAMMAAILIGDMFAAGEVAFIMAIGALLEDMTTERAKKGLHNLISLTPQEGRRIKDGKEEIIPAERIRQGDVIRVKPGEAIPVDGIILTGESSVDQSILTGESLPVDKSIGDSVYCGTINRFGAIDLRATNVSADSSLQKLIRMVEDAEKNQASVQRIADRWASWLVPVALCIAIAAYLVTGDIVRAVTVLVVFCPCALVLATPTAIMAAIGQAAKQGVIIKSGAALETMGKVKIVAFDKTGTLTHGQLGVSDIEAYECTDEELLWLVAAAESRSEHPIGEAVTAYAVNRGITLEEADRFKMTAGRGISAWIQGNAVLVGSEAFLSEQNVSIQDEAAQTVSRLRKQGKATLLAARDGHVIGVLGLSDSVREEANNVVASLQKLGTEPILLTGDHRQAADCLAESIGISQVYAELLPEDKVSAIEKLKEKGKVCMIGDGVNDAPAIKTADVGVAMGVMGTDIAVNAADVALMTDDLSKLPYLKWLSNTTVKTIRGAIALSMSINLAAVTLSVLGVLNPTTGALVHNCGSCFVVLLAALLYDRKYKN